MRILNATPLKISWIVTKLRPPELSGTFVVKGTFQLVSDGPATLLEEGDPHNGDVPDPNGPEGSLLYESDMAPFKLAADILLVATCHTPGGRPVDACPVSFRLGPASKTLNVVGRRKWERGLGVQITSKPEPFSSLRLTYAEAFGGPDHKWNPIGKGHGKESLPDGGQVQWLPRIEAPGKALKEPNGTVEPVGFGPVPREWPQRAVNMGSFTAAYMKERWPWFPADFDFSYFNAAPPDQRVKGYLKGDEAVQLINLHPQHATLNSRLPGLRPQVFLLDQKNVLPPEKTRSGLREAPLNLDTVWIDTEQGRLVLVWRGVAPVEHLKLRDLAEVHVTFTRLEETPWTPETWAGECRRSEVEQLEARAREGEEEEEEAAEPGSDVDFRKVEEQYDKQIAQLIAEAKLALREQGFDPKLLDSPAAADHLAGLAASLAATKKLFGGGVPPDLEEKAVEGASLEPSGDGADEPESVPWTRERFVKHLAAGGSFDGQDLSNLDLSGLDIGAASFSGADLSGARLVKARLAGAKLIDAVLAGAVLAEANLAGVEAQEADLTRADLTGAVLMKAGLEDADFTEAVLDGATLDGAMVARTLFCKASLKGARLDGVRGRITDFTGADLTDARLRGNELDQPGFRAGVLDRADFTGAKMKNATFEEVRGVDMVLAGADLEGLRASKALDLSGGDFRGVKAPRSFWEEARLDGARFQAAVITASSFAGASLKGVSFDGADLSGTVFEEALIEKSSMIGAKVFKGSFERAVINGSDLRNSNFFESEFWDAVIENSLLTGANLKMTKLEK